MCGDSDDSHGNRAAAASGATMGCFLQTASTRLEAANHVAPAGRHHVLHLHVRGYAASSCVEVALQPGVHTCLSFIAHKHIAELHCSIRAMTTVMCAVHHAGAADAVGEDNARMAQLPLGSSTLAQKAPKALVRARKPTGDCVASYVHVACVAQSQCTHRLCVRSVPCVWSIHILQIVVWWEVQYSRNVQC